MRRFVFSITVLVGIGLLLLAISLPVRLEAQESERCFSETNLCVSGRVLEFWNENGGLAVFGYPISPQRQEVIEGRPLQVQWFQRNRLELHPENARPYDVLLGRLSEELLENQGRIWHQTPRSSPRPGCRFFEETGFNVCDDILSAWHANGLELDGQPGKTEAENLALFGLPLGDAAMETIQGQQYLVQWFERARFEFHAENDPPYNVLLGLLGNEMMGKETPDAPDDQPLPSVQEQITFESDRRSDKQYDIYVMKADGTDQRQLTHINPNIPNDNNAHPTWSPNGTQIAFSSYRAGYWEIYLMNVDGSGQRSLFSPNNPQVITGSPAWASKPSIIAFHSSIDGDNEIYTLDLRGGEPIKLTNNTRDDAYPAWSSNDLIAFQASTDDKNTWDIWTMKGDGSGQTPWVGNSAGADGGPVLSPDNSRIVFHSNREGNMDIYVANIDGSGLLRLTEAPSNEVNPTWSPDGTKIAFQSNKTRTWQIYVMNADDGSGATQVTTEGDNVNPEWWALPIGESTRLSGGRVTDSDWNPTGKLVFTAEYNGNLEIFTMNPTGSELRNISNDAADDYSPRWSPDGRRIVFASNRNNNRDIYVMNADGSGVTRLTSDIAVDGNPDWSPNGRQIAFETERVSGDALFPNAEIYLMNADGSHQINLTNSQSYESRPAWSPDGTRIAFEAGRDNDYDIYVMNADGSGQTRLTSEPGFDEYPRWSPDGSRILFQTDRHGKYDIYLMDADGSHQVNMTNTPDHDMHPAWAPDGQYITFMSDRDGNEEIYVMGVDGSAPTNVTNRPGDDRFPDWTP